MLSNNTVKKKKPKWDKNTLEPIAKLYSSRSQFAEQNKPAYEAARVLGLLDEWFDNKLNRWTAEAIKQEASLYSSRTEFAKMSGAAYNAARRLGLLPSLFRSKLKTWDVPSIKQIADTCTNKKELKRKCASAYNAALRLGVIDELFTNQSRVAHRDCVYLWAVKNEQDLYKVGITSHTMGDYRILQVAKEAKVSANVIFIKQVGYQQAKKIEAKMKKLGSPYKFSRKFYGHSEFRYMTPNEVQQCVELCRHYKSV